MKITFEDIKQMMDKLDKIKAPALDLTIKANQNTVDWLLKDIKPGDIMHDEESGELHLGIGVPVIVDSTIKNGFFQIGNILYDAHLPAPVGIPPRFP